MKEGAEGTDLELSYKKGGWGGFVMSEFSCRYLLLVIH